MKLSGEIGRVSSCKTQPSVMSRFVLIFALALVTCCDPAMGDVQGTQKQLQSDVRNIQNQNLDNFEISGKPQNSLQRDEKLKSMSPQERRQFESDLYETFVGICNRENIEPCHHTDIRYYAGLLAKGDPDCVVTCSKEQMIKNKDHMPHGAKTIDFIAAIDNYMKNMDEDNDDDKKSVSNVFRQGCTAVGSGGCAERRFFWLPFIPAIIGLVKLAGIAAANYITAMSKSESTKYLNTVNSATRQVVKVAKIASKGSCFSADSLVNVKTNTGTVVSMPLRSLSLGDMVESVDEQTGQRTYSKVYYIEHEQQNSRAQLLRILYNDRFNATQSLGISDRHLIYVTKNGQSTARAPLKEPIMAMELEEGDVIWIMEEGKLVPSKVTGVMTYYNAVRHPLTENHHVIVDGVHASVHVLNEQLYRKLSYPLRWTFWANPEWNRSWLIRKLVLAVRGGKEPFFTNSPTELMEYWTGTALPGLLTSPMSY